MILLTDGASTRGTWLFHFSHIAVPASFVVVLIDEEAVAVTVVREVLAHFLAQPQVVVRRAKQLVRQGAEQAVAVAEDVGRVQARRAQLLRQDLLLLVGVFDQLRHEPR